MYIVIKAEHISNDSVDKEYLFPDEDDNLAAYEGGYAQVMVPSGLLQNISKYLSSQLDSYSLVYYDLIPIRTLGIIIAP